MERRNVRHTGRGVAEGVSCSRAGHYKGGGQDSAGMLDGKLNRMKAALAEHYIHLQKISVDYAGWRRRRTWRRSRRRSIGTHVVNGPAHSAAPASGRERECHARPRRIGGGEPEHCGGRRQACGGAFGVDDLVVVHTAHATLVCHKDRAQDLKKLVQKVENPGGFNAAKSGNIYLLSPWPRTSSHRSRRVYRIARCGFARWPRATR